ncbi:phosphotransferase enzyme family protein [Penicillium freii]|nr:phosphotransferase enzyme family protein [Penicillium freii]
MDNGAEVFAKPPNPNAGPAHFTVASEVATRELLRDIFNVPVPQVLVWSCDATKNLVEAEFIIEEKAPGVRLGSVWNQWPRELKLQLITQVVELENTLTTITFDRQGCIYFKDDLSALIGEAKGIHTHSAGALERYSIGPLTSNELWSGTKRNMDLDRGPWKDPREYAEALGRNEMALVESHAVPRMNYYRTSMWHPIFVLSPTDGSGYANVLWHPDLHLDNIFVNPNTYQITRIVDWQSACVAPLFYQSGVPKLCKKDGHVREGWVVPRRPEDFESLSESEQKRIDDDLESEILHKYYEAQVCKRAPRHWAVLQQQTVPTIRKPVWLVTGAWENRDLFFLRESLMELVANWEELFPGIACPIEFSREDVEFQAKEQENINGVGHLLTLFRDEAVLPVDGMVDPKDFDIARENCRKFKEIFVRLGKDDDERELFRNLWPYQKSEAGILAGSHRNG